MAVRALSKPKASKKVLSFGEYKLIADDIEGRLRPKFEAIDAKFEALKSEIAVLKWLLPLVITVIMAVFTILWKFILK